MPSLALESIAAPPDSLVGVVESIREAWREGASPDAAGVLREHPELLRYRSLVIDLAYEEYCLRDEAGHTPEPEEFCRRIPAFASQVREVIRGHQFIADNPEMFDNGKVRWPQPREEFDGLNIVRELGQGAFAHVYLARDPAAGDRPVALKLSQAPSSEAKTLGPRSHPHIVGIHRAWQSGNLHAISMPFVGATTLGDSIELAFRGPPGSGPRTARTILNAIDGTSADSAALAIPVISGGESYSDAVAAVGTRLAEALAYLHRSEVNHGDLKPSNIILGPGGHPYLIDFNLATTTHESLLRCGGTLAYMPPERLRLVRGGPALTETDPGGAADIYSLGVVLFEALTGNLPYASSWPAQPKKVAEELLTLQSAGVPSVAGLNREVPRALGQLIERCLAANPAARPTAEELARNLRRHTRRWLRRVWALGVTVLLATGLTASLLAFGGERKDAAEPMPPPTTPVRSEPETAEEFFERGVGFLRKGAVASAESDFAMAREKKPDGPNKAFLAYCLSRRGVHNQAEPLYREAIEEHGYQKAWVYNNLAYCRFNKGSPTSLELAVQNAESALALDPNLRAAHLNRAEARFDLNLVKGPETLSDPDCLKDIEAVMAEGPYTADLYYRAALILTASAAENKQQYSVAEGYLRNAIGGGRDSKSLLANPVIKAHLNAHPNFKALAELTPGSPPKSVVDPHLVDPLAQ